MDLINSKLSAEIKLKMKQINDEDKKTSAKQEQSKVAVKEDRELQKDPL